MTNNTIRFDLSDWLIHFFREIDFESSSSIIYTEHMGWGNVYEDTKYSAIYMLRCAIRNGRLWATWSYRNNARTIYGSSPAVCFTEMPIAAFLESGELRAERGEAMSQFALIFPKNNMFSLGANPVIYGLDDRTNWPPSGKGGGARVMESSMLPDREQYRYVTYNPTSPRPIDWSHEREWRWPYRGDFSHVEKALEEYGMIDNAMDIPGLDFYLQNISGMGVVVKSEDQAMWIVHDILMLIDRNTINRNQYSFVLASDSLPPSINLRSPEAISKAISDSLIDLDPFFSYSKNELKILSDRFSDLVETIEPPSPEKTKEESGGCWLWVLDNTSKIMRALIDCDRIIVSESGKYLVKLHEFDDTVGLRQREEMTQSLAKLFKKEFGIECGYFSVLNSGNPNNVPFYNDDHLDNHMYYNVSWS